MGGAYPHPDAAVRQFFNEHTVKERHTKIDVAAHYAGFLVSLFQLVIERLADPLFNDLDSLTDLAAAWRAYLASEARRSGTGHGGDKGSNPRRCSFTTRNQLYQEAVEKAAAANLPHDAVKLATVCPISRLCSVVFVLIRLYS